MSEFLPLDGYSTDRSLFQASSLDFPGLRFWMPLSIEVTSGFCFCVAGSLSFHSIREVLTWKTRDFQHVDSIEFYARVNCNDL
jgi:hypothetical protein